LDRQKKLALGFAIAAPFLLIIFLIVYLLGKFNGWFY